MTREVVVVSGVRTAIGTFGGSLKDQTPTQLGAAVLREACRRASVGTDDVHHVVFGHVVNTEPRDMYLARVATIGRAVQGHAGPHVEPSVRLGPAGDRKRGANHHAR